MSILGKIQKLEEEKQRLLGKRKLEIANLFERMNLLGIDKEFLISFLYLVKSKNHKDQDLLEKIKSSYEAGKPPSNRKTGHSKITRKDNKENP